MSEHIHFETTLKHAQDTYKQGFIDGLRAFAHWKNGIEMVGTSSERPLKEVIEHVESTWNYAPPE